ncbi:MAG: phosphoglycerate dehydrogenase, partial [Candidatus Neomarinimicrobiota bacterium]
NLRSRPDGRRRGLMKRVLITDPISPRGKELLAHRGLEVVDLAGQPIDAILSEVGGIHGWIVRSGTRVDAELLKRADNLQVVGRAGVGVDNIDLERATLRGIVVMNTPDGNTISAAEHTLALMMALSRNVHLGHGQLQVGEWDRQALRGVELRGKILGIIGLGRIGRQVMGYARSLGMQVLGYDPYAPQQLLKSDELKLVSLEELLSQSDFVTLHVPLNDETRNLIDARRLAQMKPTARLINCARGGIVNEADLVEALNNGTIAGAALDVFVNEPITKDHPLVKAKNILLTPHLGASTKEAQEGVSVAICQQVADFLLEGKLQGALNVPVADMALLKQLEPHLELAVSMGRLLSQLVEGSVMAVQVTCSGTIEDSHPVALAALRGVLEHMLDTRLNFVNTAAVARERGITFTHAFKSAEVGYANLVRVEVTTDRVQKSMAGSVFGAQHPRIVEIEGYHLELQPEGVMLFIRNRDEPGVLGRIGTTLGGFGINIGEALLNREHSAEHAYLVIKVDSAPDDEQLQALAELEGIMSVKKAVL